MESTNETKPRIEWLMQYPEPYRTQAIMNIANLSTAGFILEEVVPESAALDGFLWSESAEGRTYWEIFYKKQAEFQNQT